MPVDIEESYCCAGKVEAGAVGDWLGWEDTGFVLAGNHTLLIKFIKDYKFSKSK